MRRIALVVRVGAGVMLVVFWGMVDSPLLGVAYILAMIALSAIRYRFAPYRWLGIAETALCLIYAFLWRPALLGVWLPVIGLLEDKWEAWERELLHQGLEDREQRLELETSREIYEREMHNAAHLAEIAERSRIAQDIHDHVGHEMSGASIALQTALRLYDKGDERARDLLAQSAARMEMASEHLREAVYNLKPSRVAGISTLAELCDEFTFCPVEFSASGDLGSVSHWELLEANLKEALTNVSRHSNATLVTVQLIGNADYIRLQVSQGDASGKTRGQNEDSTRIGDAEGSPTRFTRGSTPRLMGEAGVPTPHFMDETRASSPRLTDETGKLSPRLEPSPRLAGGLGLAGIRERVRAVGGTLTIKMEDDFSIVCILPKR